MLRQELHEFQRLFDFHQDLVNFSAFDLEEEEEERRTLALNARAQTP